VAKEFPQYMPRQPTKTNAREINMPFLNPSLGKKEPTTNDTIAIERSLKASRELALTSSTPYVLMDFCIKIPTLFNNIAKTK
jgi:hypothetical protein